jgi:Gas vesicle synthesis protein GvpL/GvpF
MSEKAFYLFCFACSSPLPELTGSGIDSEEKLKVWRRADIAAVLSTCSLADFSGPEAEAKMQDFSWLGSRVLRHEIMIEKVMAYSPVLPARFGTLFSSLEKLEDLVERHERTISQFLNQIADGEEWGVKGILNREQAVQKLQSHDQTEEKSEREGELESLPEGTRYLKERQVQQVAERDLDQWLKETSTAIADDLLKYATDFRARQVVSLGNTEGEGVLNWAFLVPKKTKAKFRARVKRASDKLRSQGLNIEVTGPWPPYNFAPSIMD